VPVTHSLNLAKYAPHFSRRTLAMASLCYKYKRRQSRQANRY